MDLWVSSPFRVLAEARPDGGDDWGLQLEWKDRDNVLHQWVMPRAALAGDAAEVRARLAAYGYRPPRAQGGRWQSISPRCRPMLWFAQCPALAGTLAKLTVPPLCCLTMCAAHCLRTSRWS